MEFRLTEDALPTRTAATAIEWPAQCTAEAGTGAGVSRCGPGRCVEFPVENLGHEVIGHGEQILVRRRRAPARGVARHGARIPCTTDRPFHRDDDVIVALV